MATSLLAAAGLVAVAGPAVAESALCQQVQAQYSAAASLAQAGDYTTLRRKLTLARAQLERGNCSGLGIFRRRGQDCPATMQTARQLENQLQNAGAQRTAARRRDTLRRVLAQDGCSLPGAGGSSASAQNGVYRTLCVRTCDGYYFPLGNSRKRSSVKIDQGVCQAMYGNAKAELFVQRRSQPVANASSPANGSKYSDLAEAFAYRKHYDAACYAELQTGLAAFYAAAETRQSGRQVSGATPVPAPQAQPVSLASDPETLANRAGDFAVTPVQPAGSAGGPAAMRHLGTDYSDAGNAIPNLKAPLGPSHAFDIIKSAAADNQGADHATSVQ